MFLSPEEIQPFPPLKIFPSSQFWGICFRQDLTKGRVDVLPQIFFEYESLGELKLAGVEGRESIDF
jgi:hypothetical protein